MKRIVALLVASQLLLFPALARGQERDFVAPPVATFPPGEDRIVALKKGDAAPYTGQLFDTDTAIRWGLWLQQYQQRLKLDVETQRQLGAVQIEFLNKQLEIEKKRSQKIEESWREENEELRAAAPAVAESPWYDSFVFGATIGVVFTAAAVGLAAYGMSAVNQ